MHARVCLCSSGCVLAYCQDRIAVVNRESTNQQKSESQPNGPIHSIGIETRDAEASLCVHVMFWVAQPIAGSREVCTRCDVEQRPKVNSLRQGSDSDESFAKYHTLQSMTEMTVTE
jgi:hypothetical protein